MSDITEQLQSSLKAISDSLRAHAESAATNANLNAETRAKVDELLMAQGSVTAELKAAQQRITEMEGNGAGGDVQHLSMGRQFVNTAAFSAFAAQAVPRGRVDHTFNAAVSSLTTDAEGSAGALVQTTRLPGILELPQQRLTVRDLLMPGQMDGNALEYVRETGFTNNAAPVAELARKPESSIKFDMVSTTARVLAHYLKASRQILSDASQLASFIDGRLRLGLKQVEERQLLNGDGTGQNLLGIIPQAQAFVPPIAVENATAIDRMRLAALQSELAEMPVSGFIMHPSDWAAIELGKDTLGRYLIGNPQGRVGATLWNLPIVTTQAIAQGKFLSGAFNSAAQIFDRWQARVEVATENEDDFVKNMVTILCEERLALAVYRPEAFVYGDVNGPVTP